MSDVWDIFEGNQLFHGIDPEHHEYRRRAHLAEIVALLGPPPKGLLAHGKLSNKFFSDDGERDITIHHISGSSLEINCASCIIDIDWSIK
ncbi:unnamed protein product [Fusarium graminearum]|nr:unnamed protein product [Fusarium graminearum]